MNATINIQNIQSINDGGGIDEVITQLDNLNKIEPPRIGTISDYTNIYNEIVKFNDLQGQQLNILNNDINGIETYAGTLSMFTQIINQLSTNLNIVDVTNNVNIESLKKSINTIETFYENMNNINNKINNFENIKKNTQINLLMDNINILKNKVGIINENVDYFNTTNNVENNLSSKSSNKLSNESICKSTTKSNLKNKNYSIYKKIKKKVYIYFRKLKIFVFKKYNKSLNLIKIIYKLLKKTKIKIIKNLKSKYKYFYNKKKSVIVSTTN